MNTDTFITGFDLFIFLGIGQGFLLAWFFVRNSSNGRKANLFQGLLILFLSLAIFEELLNNTGYIVQLLPLSNFSEPLNFSFAPLFYLFIREILGKKATRKDWWHFSISIFWVFYIIFHFVQSNEFKYNSYLSAKHPDWPYLDAGYTIPEDPLYIRHFINEMLITQFITYMIIGIRFTIRNFKKAGKSLLRPKDPTANTVRNLIIHFVIIIVIFTVTKAIFKNDVGDYFIASYISFMFYTTTFQVLSHSDYLKQVHSIFDFPNMKYRKSSLGDDEKHILLSKIKTLMETDQYYGDNMASLSGLAKKVNASSHHVSQVINELLNMSFFEMLAYYRIKEAKRLFEEDHESKMTVDEVALRVGYNSKSAFNKVFKQQTTQTPSEYRKTVHNN